MTQPIPPAKNTAKTPPRPRKTNISKKPRKTSSRKRTKPQRRWTRNILLLTATEWLGLAITGVLSIMLALGSSAQWFSGPSFFANLLPFATGVAAMVVVTAGLLMLWSKLRTWLADKIPSLPAALSICLAAATTWFVFHDGYIHVFTHFRTLVGGKQQAARMTLAHQVYAAYRRYDQPQLQNMMVRAKPFNPAIYEAAEAFAMDVNLLQGVAATESSFLPRDSQDGGHGLFQITAVPKSITQEVSRQLEVSNPDLSDPRHNAYIAAATLKHYLAEMHNDLFLGLLAYNIGPKNGGLRFIMQ
jgi:hypothetical protein